MTCCMLGKSRPLEATSVATSTSLRSSLNSLMAHCRSSWSARDEGEGEGEGGKGRQEEKSREEYREFTHIYNVQWNPSNVDTLGTW